MKISLKWEHFWWHFCLQYLLFSMPPPFRHDVIKWKHFPRYWPFVRGIHRSTVNSQHKGQWRRALMFSLICVWLNGWVYNRDAGDLRHYRAHYDVTAMEMSWKVTKIGHRDPFQCTLFSCVLWFSLYIKVNHREAVSFFITETPLLMIWPYMMNLHSYGNTLRPRQNGHHVADDNFKRPFVFEFRLIFCWILFLRVQLTVIQQWFR